MTHSDTRTHSGANPQQAVPAIASGDLSRVELLGALSFGLLAVVIAGVVLVVFIIGGQFLLEALGIPLPAFQIAGGIVLFLFALTMIFGDSKPEREELLEGEPGRDVAVFPLAVPSLASPGAMMAVVLLTDNHRFSIDYQVVTGVTMIGVLFCAWILIMVAPFVQRVIGRTGASVVSRMMGLILASIAATHVLEGAKEYFQ